MRSLPIDSIHDTFLQTLKQRHLVVEAETGSGKSTRLPLWAASQGRVLVVEPRRIACTSLAEFLAQESGKPLGEQVGYAIKLSAQFDDNTQVVFVTPGVALRWYAENQLSQFDIVMVDEFHERRWDTDLLVAMLNERQSHRMIVTSATMQSAKLSRYLDATLLKASGRVFDVEYAYQARDSHHLPNQRDLEAQVVSAVESLLPSADGDILVFLPGRKEIQQCGSALKYLSDVLVVPLHASVSDSERNLALNQQPQQKIVLATNVAETSLTIPNIAAVVDSGLERRTQQRGGRTVLALRSISQASAKQRAGRAGRVQDGVCVRLFGEFAPLEQVTPPELQREELSEAMLAAACCRFGLEQLDFLDPLPEKSLANARQLLLNMKAIDDQGNITTHGEKLYPLPIDALYADLLTRMPTRALQEAMVDLAAALCVPAKLFKLPSSEESIEAIDQWEPKRCDGSTLIQLVRGNIPEQIRVEASALEEAVGLAKQMREILELPELDVASRFDQTALAEAIAKLHPELVFVRREKRPDALGNGYSEVSIGRESRFSAKAEATVVLDQHSLPGRGVKQTLTLASVNLPLSLRSLAQLGFGEWQLAKTHAEAGELISQERLVYAGRTIATREKPLEGSNAILAAITAGDLWPDFYSSRCKDIDAWNLYCELGLSSDPGQPMTFEQWFTEQLDSIGVETLEDLEMFGQSDFEFNGIPEWERADFDEKFPTQLYLGDMVLSVDYFPKRKLVQVVYQSGLRKGNPKRIELPRFSGWRIQYRKASRVVDIR
ncbi:helicase-related protein [Vibrio sp. SCSIO 43136]|uniref:helicase-related protein n=1 Tax=Vibrio sp. SCSIO 43136 TaxID=2819101 RepID=UPI002075D22F|nr:helicase-related protein [Vibrio sp. SCSIO 43136]USD64134.1 ATP-dependent RNA helicase [Vibrio sp. SCSIO 43136]